MNCYVFDVNVQYCYVAEDDEIFEDGEPIINYFPVEVGPLNNIDANIMNKVKEAVQNISSSPIKSNWWTEFSSWDDFRALLRTGTKLSMHAVVEKLRSEFKCLKPVDADIEDIDENGNIVIHVDEDSENILQGFTLRGKRKKLKTLSHVAAFNVAKYLDSENDVDTLEVPRNLKPLIKQFLVTYSADYLSFRLN